MPPNLHSTLPMSEDTEILREIRDLLRLMAAPPHHGEQGLDSHLPARAAGITPAVGTAAGGAIR